jgi:hypothetical protein
LGDAAAFELLLHGSAGCDGDIDDRGSDAGGDGFDSVVESDQGGDAVVVEGCCGGGSVSGVAVADEDGCEEQGDCGYGGKSESFCG